MMGHSGAEGSNSSEDKVIKEEECEESVESNTGAPKEAESFENLQL